MKRAATVIVLTATLSAAPGSAQSDQHGGRIVFASNRTSALIPFEARTIDVRTGRSRRIGIVRLADFGETAWSPDARAIVSTSDEGDLYVSRPGGRLTRIVRSRAAPENTAVWSPSGRRLAFFGVERKRLSVFVVAASGRGLRRVTARVAPYLDSGPRERLSWSPDGRRLALVAHRRLVLVRVGDGRARRLATGRGRPSDPVWSPDGRTMAFRAQVAGERATIRALDLVTGVVRRVSAGGGTPLWSPDGRKLAIAEKHRVLVLGPGGRRLVAATHPPLETPPAWSPDSRRLAFATNRDLVVASAETKRTRRLTRELRSFWITIDPAWSPAGRVVYVGHRRDPGDLDLHTVRSDGSGVRALTANGAGEFDPAWSPDGRRIAYGRARGRSSADVHVMSSDGTNDRRLVADAVSPAWSPDGARLAFERDGDIWTIGVDGSGLARLTAGPDRDRQPDWSPSGKEIAFARDRDRETPEIYAADVSTGAVRQITSERSRNVGCAGNLATSPAWSPDAAWIAYELEQGGSRDCSPSRGHYVSIHVVRADGTGRRFVTDGGYRDSTEDDGALTPAWSPDGSSIAFVSSLGGGDEPRGGGRIGVVSALGGPFRFLTPNSYTGWGPDWRP
jgi:Tol biopolymer transport system component